MKRKSTIKRRLSSIVDPTQRKRKATKKLTPKERLRRRRLATARNRRKTAADKVFDKGRGKVLHKRRSSKKIKAKRGRHKLAEPGEKKKGLSTAAKVGLGVAATGAAVFGARALAKKLGKKAAGSVGDAAKSAKKADIVNDIHEYNKKADAAQAERHAKNKADDEAFSAKHKKDMEDIAESKKKTDAYNESRKNDAKSEKAESKPEVKEATSKKESKESSKAKGRKELADSLKNERLSRRRAKAAENAHREHFSSKGVKQRIQGGKNSIGKEAGVKGSEGRKQVAADAKRERKWARSRGGYNLPKQGRLSNKGLQEHSRLTKNMRGLNKHDLKVRRSLGIHALRQEVLRELDKSTGKA